VATSNIQRGGDHGRFLIVTFAAGGNVPSALGLGRRLRSCGHQVRVLANSSLRGRAEAAGCAFRPLPASCDQDPSRGRALEDEGQWEYWSELLAGVPLAQAVLEEAGRQPADVLIVDCMLRNALVAAEKAGLPTAVIVHMRVGFFTDEKYSGGGWDWDAVQTTRAQLGMAPMTRTDEPRAVVEQWKGCERALVVMPVEFEIPGFRAAPNVRFVGPIFEEESVGGWPDDLPWRPDDPAPLVIVSLSSTYMHHEDVVARILEGLSELNVRVLVTLGGGLAPHEVRAARGVEVRAHVPHRSVLPHTSLLVTHAGMGTAMAAFAAGVPMLCLPLGRDQNGNAARIEALGAGRVIPRDSSAASIRDAAAAALASNDLRAGAASMADIVAGYDNGTLAVDELTSILPAAGA